MSITAAENPEAMSVEPAAAPAQPAAAENAHGDHGWVWQVTGLSMILGVMLALAINTTSRIKDSGLPWKGLGVSAAILSTYKEQNETLQGEIKSLRHQVDDLQQGARGNTEASRVLKEQLQEVRMLAGLVAVHGPGLKVTLRDSPVKRLSDVSPEDSQQYLVHDADLNGLVEELKAAGAEALAISGVDPRNMQRVVVNTTARCVGPNAVVNGTQLSAPYTIYAVGNPKDLRSALEMRNGYIQTRYLDVLKMINIEESQELVLPEYAGRVACKYARPAP